MNDLIRRLYASFEHMAETLNRNGNNVVFNGIAEIKSDLMRLSNGIRNIYPFFSDELYYLKDYLFMQPGFVNLEAYGQIRIIIKALNNELNNSNHLGFWAYIHPLIINVSQKLLLDNHYSKAVQAAFVEINARIKNIRVKIDGKELDGRDLMMKTFNEEQPKLLFEDISTTSGQNVQEGYKYIFAGAITGIRNPSAHENTKIYRDDAIRKLMFASHLMYKVDDAVKFSEIVEEGMQ